MAAPANASEEFFDAEEPQYVQPMMFEYKPLNPAHVASILEEVRNNNTRPGRFPERSLDGAPPGVALIPYKAQAGIVAIGIPLTYLTTTKVNEWGGALGHQWLQLKALSNDGPVQRVGQSTEPRVGRHRLLPLVSFLSAGAVLAGLHSLGGKKAVALGATATALSAPLLAGGMGDPLLEAHRHGRHSWMGQPLWMGQRGSWLTASS